jgi:hypothetical protein
MTEGDGLGPLLPVLQHESRRGMTLASAPDLQSFICDAFQLNHLPDWGESGYLDARHYPEECCIDTHTQL